MGSDYAAALQSDEFRYRADNEIQSRSPDSKPEAPSNPGRGFESAQTENATAPQGGSGFIELGFDLSHAEAANASTLEVRKSVRFNGDDAGQTTIRVTQGSALYIASGELRALLLAQQRNELADKLANDDKQAFIGFDEVRQLGLDLRYDAATDRILISG